MSDLIKNVHDLPKDADCISRRTAIDGLDAYYAKRINLNEWQEGWNAALDWVKDTYLDELPSAQPETAKRIVGKSRNGMTFWYQCDMCNEPVDAQDNFCRGCGRRLIDE